MGGEGEVKSRMMHVEKLRPAIGVPREIRPKVGISTRFTGTSACHHAGTWRATIANNLPSLEQRCNSLPTVYMPREDVARDRQSSMPTILENCRNIPVVEICPVAFAANVCWSLSQER